MAKLTKKSARQQEESLKLLCINILKLYTEVCNYAKENMIEVAELEAPNPLIENADEFFDPIETERLFFCEAATLTGKASLLVLEANALTKFNQFKVSEEAFESLDRSYVKVRQEAEELFESFFEEVTFKK